MKRRRSSPVPDFDADQLIAQLHQLGEAVGSQDQALPFFLGDMADGPRSGPPVEPDVPDEILARRCLHAWLAFAKTGQ